VHKCFGTHLERHGRTQSLAVVTLTVRALTAAAVVAASAGTASAIGGARSLQATCDVVPPKTVSPKHYRLWTAAPSGEWAATPHEQNPDGSLWLKAPWFAAGPKGNAPHGPTGRLKITGRRIDAASPPLRASTQQVGVIGFGGSAVWAAVITFPTAGCWTISGTVGKTQHTFRLLVTRPAP
jgi:hypothetical protein